MKDLSKKLQWQSVESGNLPEETKPIFLCDGNNNVSEGYYKNGKWLQCGWNTINLNVKYWSEKPVEVESFEDYGIPPLLAKERIIAEHYGFYAQSNQLIEECSELIKAINKYKRARGDGQPLKSGTLESTMEDLIEEISDVQVMLCEVMSLLNISQADLNEIAETKLNTVLEVIRNANK